MLNIKPKISSTFALDEAYEAFRRKLTMDETTHIGFLNNTEFHAFHDAQEDLHLNAEDIRFRAYDLLFSCYPALRENLPKDRYSHPDIVSLLCVDPNNIAVGLEASRILLSARPLHSEREFIIKVALIKQCLLKALRDILFDELTPILLQAYSKILEQRMMDLIKMNKHDRNTLERTK